MNHHQLIKAYFRQSELYHSDSKGEMLPVRAMHPRHAGNAAEKLIRDADYWSKEAGLDIRHSIIWMTQQPLYRALAERAGQ